MLSNIIQANTIPVLQEVISFTEARQAVLAGNIANLDTPGYEARDLSVGDFQLRLRAAIDERRAGEAHSPGEPSGVHGGNLAEVAKNTKSILRHDQSNVGMEYQVAEMAKNQMQHNLALSLMVQQFRLLQTTISERV